MDKGWKTNGSTIDQKYIHMAHAPTLQPSYVPQTGDAGTMCLVLVHAVESWAMRWLILSCNTCRGSMVKYLFHSRSFDLLKDIDCWVNMEWNTWRCPLFYSIMHEQWMIKINNFHIRCPRSIKLARSAQSGSDFTVLREAIASKTEAIAHHFISDLSRTYPRTQSTVILPYLSGHSWTDHMHSKYKERNEWIEWHRWTK